MENALDEIEGDFLLLVRGAPAEDLELLRGLIKSEATKNCDCPAAEP